jgi:hypothetical protein
VRVRARRLHDGRGVGRRSRQEGKSGTRFLRTGRRWRYRGRIAQRRRRVPREAGRGSYRLSRARSSILSGGASA